MIIYYYYYFIPYDFFKLALAGNLLLEADWQQVPSSLYNSSKYSADLNDAVAERTSYFCLER